MKTQGVRVIGFINPEKLQELAELELIILKNKSRKERMIALTKERRQEKDCG